MLDIEAMVNRMVPWLSTSAMASFLNMGEKVRRNYVSKTEFRLFPSRTDGSTIVNRPFLLFAKGFLAVVRQPKNN